MHTRPALRILWVIAFNVQNHEDTTLQLRKLPPWLEHIAKNAVVYGNPLMNDPNNVA